eukprot:scaffold9.g3124.t1
MAEVRRTREEAIAAAQQSAAQLTALQRQHSEAVLEHMRALAAAQQRAAEAEAASAAQGDVAEAARVARAEAEAAVRTLRLKNEMLETKLQILTECYRQLESERWGNGSQSACGAHAPAAAAAGQPPPEHVRPLRTLQLHASNEAGPARCIQCHCQPDMTDAQIACSAGLVASLPGSHHGLALACAELRCRLVQQEAETEAARQRAEAVAAQAAALKLLLARQQGTAGGTGPLLARVQAAEGQLEELQALAEGLRRQLGEQTREAEAARRERAQAQADLRGARDAVLALRASLKAADGCR